MKNISIILLLGLTMVLTSCGKDFLDVNTDPTKVTSTDPKLLLSSAIVTTAYNRGAETSIFSSLFSNYTLGVDRQAQTFSNYIVSAGDLDNLWKFGFYSNTLKNAKDLIVQSKLKAKPHYQATGNIMMAFGIVEASDLWGDIPYSEAFNGLENINPQFDAQQNIYASADALLDEAIVLLKAADNGSPLDGTSDQLYGGNSGRWIKFAYGLKARNYLHLSKKMGGAYFQKAIDAANLSLTSSADNAIFSFLAGGAYNSSPWFQFNTNRGDILVHPDFIAKLTAKGDPRYTFFVDTAGGNFIGSFFASDNSPVDLLTYEEIKFILAESKEALGQSPTADLNAAVSASVERITGAPIPAAFLAMATADESKMNIMLQKHIAMFTSPEGWNDWRRTGLPTLVPNIGAQIPRSLFYSAAEQQANANCPSNTSLYRRVWWDN